MKLIVPDYYPAFKCIAGRCKHTCCIGWEIDIDEASQQLYKKINAQIGLKLRENIDWNNGYFRLSEGERCPFLTQDGLCELIIELGENSLCQICADHPRFRNYLSDRTEMGLGLCCEAAAELILHQQQPVKLICLEDDGCTEAADEEFLALREKLLAMVQNREVAMEQRVEEMLRFAGADIAVDASFWADVLLPLERLDDAWADTLQRLKEPAQSIDPRWEVPLEQLMVYLLYRHLAGALEDGDLQGRIAYCGVVWKLIRHMLRDDLEELCRLYSSEIEYSDENMDAILDVIDGLLG